MDEEISVGSVQVSVPQLPEVTFQLKTTPTGIVLDLNAPLMPSVNSKKKLVGESILIQATAVEKEDKNISDDRNRIHFRLDATSAPLTNPSFLFSGFEEPIFLLDDGTIDGDQKGDQIWLGNKDLPSSESLEGPFMMIPTLRKDQLRYPQYSSLWLI